MDNKHHWQRLGSNPDQCFHIKTGNCWKQTLLISFTLPQYKQLRKPKHPTPDRPHEISLYGKGKPFFALKMDSLALWSVQWGFPPPVMSKLSTVLVWSISNRSHICFILVLKTDQFSIYTSPEQLSFNFHTIQVIQKHQHSTKLLFYLGKWQW